MYKIRTIEKYLQSCAVSGAGQCYTIAQALRKTKSKTLYIARDILSAEFFSEEMRFFAPDLSCHLLPEFDVLPYDNYSPKNDIISSRIAALLALYESRSDVVITTAAALLQPYAPVSFMQGRCFILCEGEKININSFISKLAQSGYERVDRVCEEGYFAVYGGQIDFFPPDSLLPIRLVLFDDEIEQIRLFNTIDQRSIKRVKSINVLPMHECNLSQEGITMFRSKFLEHFENSANSSIYTGVSAGKMPAGGEFYLPLFFEQIGRLFDYIPKSTQILMQSGVTEELALFIKQAHQRKQDVHAFESRPTLAVEQLYLTPNTCLQQLQAKHCLNLPTAEADTKLPVVAVDDRKEKPYEALINYIKSKKKPCMICVDSVGRLEAIKTVLGNEGLHGIQVKNYLEETKNKLRFSTCSLREGFQLNDASVLTEAEIFDVVSMPKQRFKATNSQSNWIQNDIQSGNKIIHQSYGIGLCHGLKTITVGGKIGDYLEIEYAEDQRLWLPIEELQQIDIYHGESPLSKMGSNAWKRAFTRAKKRAEDTAARLLEIQARRYIEKNEGNNPDENYLAQFIDAFAYEETPDQERVSGEVINDIKQPGAMDRLLSADVGFGKTEIAMRAAATIVFSEKQVVIVAPTSLLADQHYRTFSDRFAYFPVKIGLLSRAVLPKERQKTLKATADGDLDILIGTHAVLQKRCQFKNLGLAIIDEEHRFGVIHKEHFKKMRANVELLSLSATPIPRTLAMAFAGIRDLSIISTPPPRLSVKTMVTTFAPSIIKEACERELRRGGQIYFIHNEIATLEEMARQISLWLPRVKIQIAHGSMHQNAMKNVMHKFLRREVDILLCTTIVESGLDISNANTIIINRSDRMGLSRLHQLRGRVGRNNIQAYAYFLYPEHGQITPSATKRLQAIEEHSALGSGTALSMRDLEIRGAGEILGERQSGDIETIGLANYQRLIQGAVALLSGKQEAPDTDKLLDIKFDTPSLLPNRYIPSPVERMHYYRRLNEADFAKLDNIHLEWLDRFGQLPEEARVLIDSHRLRLIGKPIGVEKINVDKSKTVTIKFCDNPPPAVADKIIKAITINKCQPAGSNGIRLKLQGENIAEQCDELRQFLTSLN